MGSEGELESLRKYFPRASQYEWEVAFQSKRKAVSLGLCPFVLLIPWLLLHSARWSGMAGALGSWWSWLRQGVCKTQHSKMFLRKQPCADRERGMMVSFSSLCFYYKLAAYFKNEWTINNLKQIKGRYYHYIQDFEDNSSTRHIYGCLLCLAVLYFSHNDVIRRKTKTKGEETTQYGIQSNVKCKSQAPGEPEFIPEIVRSRGLTWVCLPLPHQRDGWL